MGGGNAPLPPYCDADLAAAGYPNGAPLTYRPDSTQNYEIGSKNTIGESLRIATSVYYIKWNDIQQNLYVAGNCGLQFTDNLGTAAAWGGDLQAELALGQVRIDFATGYTSARYTKSSPADAPRTPRAGRHPVQDQRRRCDLRAGSDRLCAGYQSTLHGRTRCGIRLPCRGA